MYCSNKSIDINPSVCRNGSCKCESIFLLSLKCYNLIMFCAYCKVLFEILVKKLSDQSFPVSFQVINLSSFHLQKPLDPGEGFPQVLLLIQLLDKGNKKMASCSPTVQYTFVSHYFTPGFKLTPEIKHFGFD